MRAAYERGKFGLIDNWLRHVQDVRDKHSTLLPGNDPAADVDRLCELNVLEQAHKQSIIMQQRDMFRMHSWDTRVDRQE